MICFIWEEKKTPNALRCNCQSYVNEYEQENHFQLLFLEVGHLAGAFSESSSAWVQSRVSVWSTSFAHCLPYLVVKRCEHCLLHFLSFNVSPVNAVAFSSSALLLLVASIYCATRFFTPLTRQVANYCTLTIHGCKFSNVTFQRLAEPKVNGEFSVVSRSLMKLSNERKENLKKYNAITCLRRDRHVWNPHSFELLNKSHRCRILEVLEKSKYHTENVANH